MVSPINSWTKVPRCGQDGKKTWMSRLQQYHNEFGGNLLKRSESKWVMSDIVYLLIYGGSSDSIALIPQPGLQLAWWENKIMNRPPWLKTKLIVRQPGFVQSTQNAWDCQFTILSTYSEAMYTSTKSPNDTFLTLKTARSRLEPNKNRLVTLTGSNNCTDCH